MSMGNAPSDPNAATTKEPETVVVEKNGVIDYSEAIKDAYISDSGELSKPTLTRQTSYEHELMKNQKKSQPKQNIPKWALDEFASKTKPQQEPQVTQCTIPSWALRDYNSTKA